MSNSTSLPPTESLETQKQQSLALVRDAELLISTYLPSSFDPPPAYTPATLLPVCIPQLKVGLGGQFARGYNPELGEKAGIEEPEFLGFIDGLNLAIVASPPLRVVDLAGMAIGFVPYHWAIIAGALIQTAAQTAMHVLSKTLTDRYLRAANKTLFHPRGLTVRLCTTRAMLRLIDPDRPDGGEATKLQKAGRVAGGVLLRLPIPFSSKIVRAVADPAPKIAATSKGVAADPVLARRLALLGPQALPLSLDVPPPQTPEGVMDRMSAYGVKFDKWRADRSVDKKEDKRRRLVVEQATGVRQRSGPISGIIRSISGKDTSGYDDLTEEQKMGLGAPARRDRGVLGIGHGRGPITKIVRGVAGLMNEQKSNKAEEEEEQPNPNAQPTQEFYYQASQTMIASNSSAAGFMRKESPLERKVKNADLMEYWQTDRVLWVVIMSKSHDEEIIDVEIADEDKDEEMIPDKLYQEEIAMEKKERQEEEEMVEMADK